MKHYIKYALAMMLILALICSLSITAFAADSIVTFKSLEEGWEFSPGSEYSATDLFDEFKSVMPGDRLTDRIEVKNIAPDCNYIKVYFRVEPSPDSNMQLFLAQLKMRIYNGTELIYESSPDQADTLADNIFLGSLMKDESLNLTVELDVPTEMDNAYANAIGEIDWIFLAEGIDFTKLTVHKIWDDNGYPERPENITVVLNRDGEAHESVLLNQDNQWTHTWEKLDDRYEWTVTEEVPDGYEATYAFEDNTIFITNFTDYTPAPEPSPVDLTVKKEWKGLASKDAEYPDKVTVTLYNGKVAVDKVTLSAKNNWTYTWSDLDGSGKWSVLETGIPKGYVPSYKTKGEVVTITNTATLIQTGQLNWPILVLGILGLLMIGYGVYLLTKKRNHEHA